MPVDLIDIGANLTHHSFDEDRDEVIQRASDAGVHRMILTGSSEQGSRNALSLAANWPERMYATAGVHPHHASDYSDAVHLTLSELTAQDAVVAVGECGLDYFRNFSPQDHQRDHQTARRDRQPLEPPIPRRNQLDRTIASALPIAGAVTIGRDCLRA